LALARVRVAEVGKHVGGAMNDLLAISLIFLSHIAAP
jgi:hypothetical protein